MISGTDVCACCIYESPRNGKGEVQEANSVFGSTFRSEARGEMKKERMFELWNYPTWFLFSGVMDRERDSLEFCKNKDFS